MSRLQVAVDLTLNLDFGSGSGGWVAQPVRARRLTEEEGRRLTQIVRRGCGPPIRVRRATITVASALGTPVPAIARLVTAERDTVRDVIHAFCAMRRSVISLA